MRDKGLGIAIALGMIVFVLMWSQTNGFSSPSLGVMAVHVDDEAPTVNDDLDRGYGPGWFWIDQTGVAIYSAVSTGDGAADWNQIDAAGGSGGHTIRDEGVDRTARTGLNFIGAGVSCVDDAGGDETDCTIAGGGSGIETQEGDVQVTAAPTVLDFGPGFDLTDSPAGETNVVLDLTENQVDVTTEITGIVPIGNGGTGQVTATEDGVLMGNTSAFIVAVVPDCQDSSGNHLNFNNTIDAWDCGTSVRAIDISDDTNLVAGTGATLTGDSISVDLGTSIDISDETNLSAGTGATLTGDVISVDLGTSIVSGEIVDGTISEADIAAVDAPADEECLTFESTVGDFEWQTCGGGSSDNMEAHRAVSAADNIYYGISGGATSSSQYVVDLLYAQPLFLGAAYDTDAMVLNVNTAAGGGALGRLCLYDDDGAAYPDNLIQDAGTFASDSTGRKTVTFTEISLTAGMYWVAFFHDDVTLLLSGRTNSSASNVHLGFDSTTFVGPNWGWTASQAFGACPDPFPGGGSLINTNAKLQPMIGLRLVP